MFLEHKNQVAEKDKTKRTGKGDDLSDVPLVLQDVRPAVFLALLEFIYSNSCKLTQSIVIDVLASSTEYGLEGLTQCCEEYITKNLSVDTVCDAIQVRQLC